MAPGQRPAQLPDPHHQTHRLRLQPRRSPPPALRQAPDPPLDRLLAAGVLPAAQQTELLTYRNSLNPAAIAHQIADLQAALLRLAKDKTEQLYLAAIPAALPALKAGIRIKSKTTS
ncbi:hypothetical protein MSHO_20080 [Mycobacterium shottsii]|uniref:Uncharacterized protein n=1 Tax=Mycobacterium shottsii TaxID=133549 RepID=A0A7I7LBN8_9MYCO|nr:hypothetical protein [Mycobacterium shottsii]BBX56663.1 hypothetical protein MSHO_20080 [Mycobacterium shottsii]